MEVTAPQKECSDVQSKFLTLLQLSVTLDFYFEKIGYHPIASYRKRNEQIFHKTLQFENFEKKIFLYMMLHPKGAADLARKSLNCSMKLEVRGCDDIA